MDFLKKIMDFKDFYKYIMDLEKKIWISMDFPKKIMDFKDFYK